MVSVSSLEKTDPEIYRLIEFELERQSNQLELIASENIVSSAVLEAQGSIFTNKYAEGYPNRRYYGGCDYADEVESLAIARARKIFQAEYANVLCLGARVVGPSLAVEIVRTWLATEFEGGRHQRRIEKF